MNSIPTDAVRQEHVAEPARTVPLFGSHDVVVLGGGPAGIAAAHGLVWVTVQEP